MLTFDSHDASLNSRQSLREAHGDEIEFATVRRVCFNGTSSSDRSHQVGVRRISRMVPGLIVLAKSAEVEREPSAGG